MLGVEYLGATEEEIMSWEQWSGNGTAFGTGKDRGWRITVKDLKVGSTEASIFHQFYRCSQFSFFFFEGILCINLVLVHRKRTGE